MTSARAVRPWFEVDRSHWLQWMHAIWTSQDICIKMVKMHHISFWLRYPSPRPPEIRISNPTKPEREKLRISGPVMLVYWIPSCCLDPVRIGVGQVAWRINSGSLKSLYQKICGEARWVRSTWERWNLPKCGFVQKVSIIPIGSMLLVYMVTFGVYWW